MYEELDKGLVNSPSTSCPSLSRRVSTETKVADTGTLSHVANTGTLSKVADTGTLSTAVISEQKNPIYDYFLAEGKDAKVCKSCKTKISAKTGTTTAVINHLKRKHVSDFQDYEAKKTEWLKKKSVIFKFCSETKGADKGDQPTIKSTFQKHEIWPATNSQAIQVTKQIGKFIIGGFHPYSIVEETEFKCLMKLTSPRFQVPCRTTFSRSIIPKMYDTLTNKIKNELRSVSDLQSWSFTTDGWTSRKNDGYMSLTFHYLSDNYEIKSYCLALKQLSVQHTGANIYSAINEIIQEWNIENIINHPSKIPIYAVTDGAANMKSAIALSKNWIHIYCFGHVLQLCVEDAIKETVPVSHLLAKCRTIVGHYSRSSVANARLRAEQEKLGLKPLELIQDVPTRWNSQYFMLERLIRCRNAINLELGTSDTQIKTLKGIEWILAENILKVFEPLVEATTFSSGETYPTISAVLPMIFGIEMVLNEIDEKEGLIPFGEAIRKNLKSRFRPLESNTINLISTLTDPKYKLAGLKQHLHLDAQTRLRSELKSQFTAAPSTQQSNEEVTPSTSRSIFKYLEQESDSLSHMMDDDIDTEVKMYLKTPKIKQNECSLTWWNQNKALFPKIAKVAHKYLGIPATSVPSERLFSSAGIVISSRRQELLPEHAEQLVVLHDNIKYVT